MTNKLILSTLLCAAVFALLLLTSKPARADTNVTVDVWSDETVNFFSNLNTTGDINLNIDGTNFNQALGNIQNTFESYITRQDLSQIFDGVAKYFAGGKDIQPAATSIFNSLNSVFVNRANEQVINAKLDNLNMRVIALEKTMEQVNSTAYCQGKLDVMKEYNISWIKCGAHSTYYYNVDPANYGGNQIIGIEPVSSSPVTSTADMKITTFSISSLKAGGNATVDVAVKNVGNKEGSVSISLQLPEGWSATPTQYNPVLNPSEEKTFEFTIVVPQNAKEKGKIGFVVSFVLMNEQKQLTEEKEVTIAPREWTVQKQAFGYGDLLNINSLIAIIRQSLKF